MRSINVRAILAAISAWANAHRKTSAIGGIIVVLLACGACSNLAGLGNDTASVTPTATTFIEPPVETPVPTKASATPAATPTALPKPTLRSVVSQVAARAGLYGNYATDVKTDLDTATGTATVTITIGDQFDYNAGITTVKIVTFQVEHDLWTNAEIKALGGLSEVDVVVLGPTQDQYGNSSTGKYGEADLTQATASLFNWGNLTFDSAWGDYDYTWLIPR